MEKEKSIKLRAELERLAGEQHERVYHENWFEGRQIEAKENTFNQPGEHYDEMGCVVTQLLQLKSALRVDNKDELAISCKMIGNECFQRKFYEGATVAYSKGIAFYPEDRDLKASLYNNRAAADFYLKNYRSSLRDCKMALKFNSNHQKASERAAQCRKILKLPEEIDNPSNEKFGLCVNNVFTVGREENWETGKLNKVQEKNNINCLIQAVKDRNIQFESGKIDLKSLTPTDDKLKDHRVSLVDGRLIWPTNLLYVDFGQLCLMQEFDENAKFADRIDVIYVTLSLSADCRKYLPEHFLIYFARGPNLFRFRPNKTLKEILSLDSYIITEGAPHFIVALKGGKQELLLLSAGYNLTNLD